MAEHSGSPRLCLCLAAVAIRVVAQEERLHRSVECSGGLREAAEPERLQRRIQLCLGLVAAVIVITNSLKMSLRLRFTNSITKTL